MPRVEPSFELPARVDSYLATLNRMYQRAGESLLREIVVNSDVSIQEGWHHDNWNGGTYGHAISLAVPEDLFVKVFEVKENAETRIAADMNRLHSSETEHIYCVTIELIATEESNWREESGIYRSTASRRHVSGEVLRRIWGDHTFRVFLSHKANVKIQTSQLKKSFDRCGIGAFVAHEDIEPTQEWQKEIERALFSMDVLTALLTADFHDSNWTDQEVGVAIGRGVPVIAVRLGLDPYGLMGKSQGLGGCSFSDTDDIAIRVFRLLVSRFPDKSRLFDCARSAYAKSTTYADSAWKVENLLTCFPDLSTTQVQQLLVSYRENPQNKTSFKGKRLLAPLLKRWTGDDWAVVGDELCLPKQNVSDVPF